MYNSHNSNIPIKPVRILLPLSASFIILPCVFRDELMNFYAFPIFYFFGMFGILSNFPQIAISLYKKPIYLHDLIIQQNQSEKFKKMYNVIMNVTLSILFAVFSEYVLVQGVQDKSIVEIFGIIGGNMALYMKIQNIIGKILLNVCYKFKQRSQRKLSDENINRDYSPCMTRGVG